MENDLLSFESDEERVAYLKELLVFRATKKCTDESHAYVNDSHYRELRRYFMNNPLFRGRIPSYLRENSSLEEFWSDISIYPHYKDRRIAIKEEFSELVQFIESDPLPHEDTVSSLFQKVDADNINLAWSKALERRNTDPEGAITMARTLLESTCKHILAPDASAKDLDKMDLPELYKETAKRLNLSPDQHSEQVFKQILGGCSGIVSGLGELRNKLSDSHGKGPKPAKPNYRHADLAVNLASSMALFLIQTHDEKNND